MLVLIQNSLFLIAYQRCVPRDYQNFISKGEAMYHNFVQNSMKSEFQKALKFLQKPFQPFQIYIKLYKMSNHLIPYHENVFHLVSKISNVAPFQKSHSRIIV